MWRRSKQSYTSFQFRIMHVSNTCGRKLRRVYFVNSKAFCEIGKNYTWEDDAYLITINKKFFIVT